VAYSGYFRNVTEADSGCLEDLKVSTLSLLGIGSKYPDTGLEYPPTI